MTLSLWLLHLNRSGLFDRQRRPRGEGRSAPPDHARPAYFRAGGATGGPVAVRIVLRHTLQDDVLWPERRRRDQLPALWAGEERGGVESMDALRRSPRRVSGSLYLVLHIWSYHSLVLRVSDTRVRSYYDDLPGG